jgi:hypothetical protein
MKIRANAGPFGVIISKNGFSWMAIIGRVLFASGLPETRPSLVIPALPLEKIEGQKRVRPEDHFGAPQLTQFTASVCPLWQ